MAYTDAQAYVPGGYWPPGYWPAGYWPGGASSLHVGLLAQSALAAWLRRELRLRSVVATDGPIAHDALPGAILLYVGTRPNDALDPGVVIESYAIDLVPRQVGAGQPTQAHDLAVMDGWLALAAKGPQRADPAWEHIEFSRAQRKDGAQVWIADVWVRPH